MVKKTKQENKKDFVLNVIINIIKEYYNISKKINIFINDNL